MKNDLLAYRHIGISEKDEEKMLQKIGVKSLDELIDKTIPANIRLKEPLALPKTMTEYEFGQHIAGLAAKNKLYTTYIGMGWYNTITPAVIQRNVFEAMAGSPAFNFVESPSVATEILSSVSSEILSS